MTLADVFLVCFLVGLTLTVVFSVAGSTHLHLPHLHLNLGGAPHVHAPHAGGSAHGNSIAPINMGTTTAFFAWFGGTGFLATHYGLPLRMGFAIAVTAGIAGSALVFWFLARVLVSERENLDPADYEMVGVFGRITSSIRAGGIGELVFSQQGTRRTTAARTEDGTPIAKGAEVIVVRYERGIAYVRNWETTDTSTMASNPRVES
jgi:membrane protein implicated in regulation of membrane protease activity